MCLITEQQSVSDQDRLTGDAVGLENAKPTNGCWMMYTLPVSKWGSASPQTGGKCCVIPKQGVDCGLGMNSTSGRAKQYCL